jgi:hypothetical protein
VIFASFDGPNDFCPVVVVADIGRSDLQNVHFVPLQSNPNSCRQQLKFTSDRGMAAWSSEQVDAVNDRAVLHVIPFQDTRMVGVLHPDCAQTVGAHWKTEIADFVTHSRGVERFELTSIVFKRYERVAFTLVRQSGVRQSAVEEE